MVTYDSQDTLLATTMLLATAYDVALTATLPGVELARPWATRYLVITPPGVELARPRQQRLAPRACRARGGR